jgi:hypothetical protein
MSAAGVVGDDTASEVKVPRRKRMVTTLYDLIAAVNDSIAPGEEELVTVAVVDLLHAGRVTYRGRPLRCARAVSQAPHDTLLLV